MTAIERLRENMDILSLRAVSQKTNIDYERLRRASMYAKIKEVLSIAEMERLEGFLVIRGKAMSGHGSDSPR